MEGKIYSPVGKFAERANNTRHVFTTMLCRMAGNTV